MKKILLPLLFISSFAFGQIKKNGGQTIETHKDKFGGTYYTYKSNESDTIKKKKQNKSYIDSNYKYSNYNNQNLFKFKSSSFFDDDFDKFGLMELGIGFNIFINMNIGYEFYEYQSLSFVNDYLESNNLKPINTNNLNTNYKHTNIGFDATIKLGLIYFGFGTQNFNKPYSAIIYQNNIYNINYKHHLGNYFSLGTVFSGKKYLVSLGLRWFKNDGNTGLYFNNNKMFKVSEDNLLPLSDNESKNSSNNTNLYLKFLYKNLSFDFTINMGNSPFVVNRGITQKSISIGYNLFNLANFINKNK